MNPTQPDEEPSLSDYPGHTAAFGRIMQGSSMNQATAQGAARGKGSEVGDLMKVTDEELIILTRLPVAANIGADLEMARRTLARTTEAIGRLGVSIERLRGATDLAGTKTSDAVLFLDNNVGKTTEAVGELLEAVGQLRGTTREAGAATTTAIGQLEASIAALRASTDKWSRWLALLTISIFGLTLLLVVLTIAQAVKR